MIPLESDQYKSDPVINQHIMQMIDTDIFWYGKTFRAILMELWKIRNGESTAKPGKELSEQETHYCDNSHVTFNDQRLYTGEKTQQDHKATESISDESKVQKDWPRKHFQMDKKEPYESAMVCWESLDNSKQASKKRKTHGQDAEMNDDKERQANEMDDRMHIKQTVDMGNQLNIPVDELKLGADNDTSMLTTQETLVKNSVYITNVPEGKLGTTKNVQDSSKNPSKQDNKNFSPLEKYDSITSNDNLKAYRESGRDDNLEKGKERKKKTKNMQKIIHMEFETDDDVAEQSKNANDVKAEGKVQVRKKTIPYYEFSSEEEEGEHDDPKKFKKTQDGHENPSKNDENDQALVSNEMTISSIGNDIFIGDSAATSHMTNNKTGVYDLTPIRGSVMIGNGESISCTHKGKLDVICKHRDGSTARETWEVKIVPQLNHDLFSFTKAMKEGWQMNGRWKEGGFMIELFKTTKASMKFDRMILSGSSWLMGIKTQRLVGQAHTVIEPGKSIPIWKFHQMTGHTGEHLLRTTAENMGIKLTGKLEPCEICAQAKIRQANITKKKEKQVLADLDTDCSLI